MVWPVLARAQDQAAPAAQDQTPATQTQAAPAQPAAEAAGRTKAPAGAKAYIIWPRNGAVIKGGKFWIRMGLQNMGIAPAGTDKPNTGHHHLIIDEELPPMDEPIPNDAHHLHFGGGQTEARIELPKGTHTLQLLLGDANHVPHDPPVLSERITIRVR
jgi:hypothetical protein